MSPSPGSYRHTDGCTHELARLKTGWQMRRLSTVSGQWGDWYPIDEAAVKRLLGFGQLTKLDA